MTRKCFSEASPLNLASGIKKMSIGFQCISLDYYGGRPVLQFMIPSELCWSCFYYKDSKQSIKTRPLLYYCHDECPCYRNLQSWMGHHFFLWTTMSVSLKHLQRPPKPYFNNFGELKSSKESCCKPMDLRTRNCSGASCKPPKNC